MSDTPTNPTNTSRDRPMPPQTEPSTDTDTDTKTDTNTQAATESAAEAEATQPSATERVELGNLSPGALTDTQEELIRLLAEYPGKQAKFYRERAGIASSYLPTLRKRYPNVVQTDVPDTGGHPVYRLTTDAWEVYAATGIVPEDTLANAEAADVEVPSERHERGNVSFEGPPLDATMQYFHERPAAQEEPESDSEADTDASDEAGAEESAGPGPGPGRAGGASLTTRVGVEVSHGDVLAILTVPHVDEAVKERLYRQAVGLAGEASSDE